MSWASCTTLTFWVEKLQLITSSLNWLSLVTFPDFPIYIVYDLSEHNPFGDDEEDESETTHSLDKPNSNHNNAHAQQAPKELKKYDKTLNPFGDSSPGDEIPPKTVPAKDTNIRGAPAKEVNGTSHEKSKQKKIIPANPFEVSDEEEEVEQISRKRLTVPEEIKSAEKPKKSPNTRHHDKIILPSVGKTAPKKKHAPAPPPPTSTTTEPQLKSAKTSEESAPVINTDTPPKSNTNGGESISESLNNSVNSTDSKFNELDSSEIRSPDMIKRRSKPAPPRPMPPKRRVCISIRSARHQTNTVPNLLNRWYHLLFRFAYPNNLGWLVHIWRYAIINLEDCAFCDGIWYHELWDCLFGMNILSLL